MYKHTTPNGKVYIGITGKNPLRRWDGGRGYQSQPRFYRAVLKYGWDNIKHEVMFDGLTKAEACEIERKQIAAHNSNDPQHGYNLSSGGECAAQGVCHFIGFEKDGFTVIGASGGKLLFRCGRCGKTIERYHAALTQKAHIKCECMKVKPPEPKKYLLIEYKGKVQNVAEWARETGISRHVITRRFKAGWSAAEIFGRPVRKY